MLRRRAARTRSTRSSIWRSRTGSTSATCWRSSTSTRSCVADNLTDPGVLIALGDGGAHVDMLCDAGYPTYLLGTWVRERQIMTLEQAIQRLTAQPADLFGIKGRGRLAVGQAADIAIFDPDDDRLGEPRRAPLRPAGRRQAHGHAVARRRIHDRQRRWSPTLKAVPPARRAERCCGRNWLAQPARA